MGRNCALSETEKASIKVLNAEGLTVSAISTWLRRSRNVITKFLQNPDMYGVKKSPGRTPKLSPKARRLLLREASKTGLSSKKLQTSLKLNVTPRRVRHVLKESKDFAYKKRKTIQALTKLHKKKREQWVREKVRWNDGDWAKVVFSDEKKFNLDGPDGFQCYWHDLRREEQLFSKRPFGGGSLMIWGAFSSKGKAALVRMEGRQTALKYTQVLEKSLEPFLANNHPDGSIFQQDNAAINTAKLTSKWFADRNIEVLSWPAKSPDLNPIENLWGILARRVYSNGRTFEDKESLWSTVEDCWRSIMQETLDNLIKSMGNRCVDVLQSKGNPCKY